MIQIPPNKEEFIGCAVIIERCTDPTWIGKQGIIVDETNTIKKIEKKTAIFQVKLPERTIRIKGSKINYRPEDRIKKAR